MKVIQKFYYLVTLVALVGLLWPATLSAQEEIICETEVTVQADDWLSKIAEKAYGDPLLYPALVTATNARAATDRSYTAIDDPDLIEPGWKICVPGLAEAQALAGSGVAAANPAALTIDELKNATYSGIYDEPVTLTGGLYEGEPFVEGGAARPRVEYINGAARFGDLNGDGAADAAVVLVENSGGSGVFTYIAVQLNQDGQPVDAGAVWVGDRTQIKSTAIDNGQIVLEIVTQGPDDPQCCPGLKVRKTYTLQDGQLAEIGSEELGQISAADLNGATWTLVDLNFDRQPALVETEVTLSFQDGQISGSGGCNSYSSSFSPDQDNPLAITINPIIATRRACPEPILDQEAAYFTALENTSQWGYQAGRLALVYQDDQGNFGTLIFEPQANGQTEAGVTATEVIIFTPADIPADTQAGSCFTNAIGLSREDAWRCTVGNQIFDPCFAVGDAPTLICGADPATGETGFVLELTEPLPEPETGQPGRPWLIELADGQICGLLTGTVPGAADRIAPYGCPDGSYLFEDFQQGQVWLAEKAVIGLNEDGYFVEQSELVPIRRVWQ